MPLRVENGIPIVPTGPEHFLSSIEPVGFAPPFSKTTNLNIPWVFQDNDSWCWAACVQMVLSAFGNVVDKCEVAGFFLDEKNCCQNHGKDCNVGCDTKDFKKIYKHFSVGFTLAFNQLLFSDVQSEITDNQAPIQIRIKWVDEEGNDLGGHVLVIDGWRIYNQVRIIKFKDPWYGYGEKRFSDLQKAYITDDGYGHWVATWSGFRPE